MEMYQLISVILLAVAFDSSEACSCSLSHVQDHFCSADFVMKVRVRTEEIIYKKEQDTVFNKTTGKNETVIHRYPLQRKYFVRINKIFRRNENSVGLQENSTIGSLYTAHSGSMCGRPLKTHHKYLIAGRFKDGQMVFTLCDWVDSWLHLSKRQKKNLHHIYKLNCDCKIKDTHYYHGSEDKLLGKKECSWDGFGRDSSCYTKESACIHDKNDSFESCKWHRSKQWRICMRSAAKRPRWMEP